MFISTLLQNVHSISEVSFQNTSILTRYRSKYFFIKTPDTFSSIASNADFNNIFIHLIITFLLKSFFIQ